MTIDDLIKSIDGQIATKLAARNSHAATLADMRGAEEPDEVKYSEVRGLKDGIDAEIDLLQARRAELVAEEARDAASLRLANDITPSVATPKYDEVARVQREARTYTKDSSRSGVSFFGDMFRARTLGDPNSNERLSRHGSEVRVEGEMSERALATGGLAGLVPPQYLVDEYAPLARAGRPTANLFHSMEIPTTGMSFIIPRGTTGVSAAVQATENSAVSTTDIVTANVTLPVATVAGYAPVSRQSLERGTPGVDQLIIRDLFGAYGVAVDQQVLSGTGSSGQVLGILATSGINTATSFSAAATVTTFYSKLAGQLNAIETTRYMAPNAIIMHPRRWNWLVSQVDSSTRPLVIPNANGPFNAVGTFDSPQDTPSAAPVGTILGLPVITDASIPTTVGTASEDQVLVMRLDDSVLYEDSPTPTVLSFEQTAGTSLTVTIVAYGYVAFSAGRYPTSVGVVGGISGAGFGLIAPTF